MLTRKVRIDLDPNSALAVVNCNQYDEIANCLEISLFKNSQAFTIPSGATVKIQGTKPDMHGFQYDAKSFSGNTVVCDLTQQMTAVAGEVPTEIRIFDTNDNTAHTANFILQVEESALSDDTIMSDTEISGVENLRQIVEQMEDISGQVESAHIAAGQASASASSAAQSASTATSKASEAAASAASALSSKNDAVDAANRAEVQANAAHDSEGRASVSAQTASDKARDANIAATNAVTSEQNAAASAQTATAKAQEATTAANTATSKASDATARASEAAQSAQIATNKASDATTAAQTATSKSSEATTAAHTATSKASEAAQSAADADASATSASASADRAEQAAQATEGTVKWPEQNALGAKNILTITPYITTDAGVTITKNDDNSYTLNGTATRSTRIITYDLRQLDGLYGRDYAFSSGRTYDGTRWNVSFSYKETQSSVEQYVRDGVAFSLSDTKFENYKQFNVFIYSLYVVSGTTFNGEIFKPMLTLASVYKANPDYAPYAMTNRELTEKVQITKTRLQNTQEYFPALYDKMNLAAAILTEFGSSKSIYVEARITEEVTINAWNPVMLLPSFNCPSNWNNQFMATLHVSTASDERFVLLKGYSDNNQIFGLRPIKNLTLPASTIRFYCEFIYTENTPV